MLTKLCVSLCFAIFIITSSISLAIEPQHEYEKPGYNEGHAYDGLLPEESIDLFTGGLQIAQQDFHVNDLTLLDRFESLVTRRYSSKIFRQQINGGTCSATAQPIEDEFAGEGWTVHFGRLWDFNQFGLANGHPVLELPNGSRHVFSLDSGYPGRMVTRSGWILFQPQNNEALYDVCSPGPDSICFRFWNNPADYYVDVRGGGRQVLHAWGWFYAGLWLINTGVCDPLAGPTFTYDRDASGHVWPKEIHTGCWNDGTPLWTTFNWDEDALQPTMDSITFHVVGGQPVNYTYQYITQNGHILLDRSTTPQGKTYKYDYDPSTNELIRITISTDTIIDSTDAVVEFTYATQTFPINSFFLSNACTRVVTQKKIKKPDGTFDVWTYSYPSSSPHKVVVTDPKGNKRETTFQGYSLTSAVIWNVGNILKDEIFDGATSLVSVDSVYDFKQVTNALDPEAALQDTVKIPVLLSSTKTFSQTGQQAVTSYGTAANYDRYGNPDFKVEKNFDGTTLRTTQYQYEYKDGDGDDQIMIDANYVRDLSKVTVLDSSGQKVSEVSYEHYNQPPDVNVSPLDLTIGAVSNVLTWDSVTDTTVRTTYEYSWLRERYKIDEQTESGTDFSTESWTGICNGKTFNWVDPMSSEGANLEAGALFQSVLDPDPWVYTTIYGMGYLPATTMNYDLDLRLTQITPPAGDATVVNYDDANRKVSVSQGTALTTETYDNRGRLAKTEKNISPGVVSTQTFEYDALNNLTRQSEKSLSQTPTTFINKTYDAMNRVTSITTADGTTTYSYNGPDVTITVASELGSLITTMKYDAGGRLIKVVEPNSVATTYAYDANDHLIRVCHNDTDDICSPTHTNRRDFVYSSRGLLISETHPESGTTTYTYDVRGRMIEKKIAGAVNPIRYTYDDRARLINIDYPNDPDVSFYYDGQFSLRQVPGYESQLYGGFPIKQLTGMVDSTGTTLWTDFNTLGQLLLKETHLNGIPNAIGMSYTYDSRGNLDSITYPSGQKISLPRNDGNAISSITRQFGTNPVTNLVNSVSYNAAFLPSNIAYGNGVNLSITSDVRNRPDVMSSAGKLTLDYRYNARGLIDQIITGQNGGPNQARDITYDNLGRIASFNAFGSTVNYSFDNFGNLLQKSGTLSAGPFTYTNNQISGVTYSAPGNQLAANGKTLTYNDENRLIQTTGGGANTTYVYDGKGNRVKSIDNVTGKTRFFIYDDAAALISEMTQLPTGEHYIDKEYVNGPSGTLATAALDEIPRGLKIYDLNLKVRLEWSPTANCGIIGYNVYRSTTQNGTYTLQNTGGPIVTGFYDDANVTECTTYWYQIKTVYTGGVEGAASSKTSHKFINYTAVLYNSPSPGVGPLNVTFTFNKGGTCPAVGSTSYVLDFGDGTSQNFSAPGTTNHTYTNASSCYPYCTAKLTVTFTNGIVATQRRLTSMSTDLVTNENFDDGVADGFTVAGGTWTSSSGTYTGTSTGTTWGISYSGSSCNNCVIQAQTNTVNQTNKNAYVIFGYTNATNFQYAGYDIAAGKWAIGDVVNGTKTDRASFSQTITTGAWHTLDVRLEAASKTVTLKGDGVTKVMWTFTNLYSLPIGLAIKGGQSSFDNFKIAPAYTVTNFHNEDFNDGIAQGYVPVTGTWSIVSSRYRGTIATTTDAVSLTPVATFNSGVIAGDIRVVTANGWYVFDYVNSTNFKFAGIDEPTDKWVIGDVVNGTKTYRATFTQTLNVNTVYPVKILLEGSTVTIINSNTIKVRFAFASLTARPVGMGVRGSATGEFDNVLIYNETFPSGPVSNPPAVPPPTSTAGATDLGALSYDSPPFYYNLNDHLGTTRIVTNGAGVVTGSFEYWPFGELKSSTGCAASSQRFTGKLFDNESGLQYFGARYLSNDLIRFSSADPIDSASTLNPQSWNKYSYSLNCPLNFKDPSGMQAEEPPAEEEMIEREEEINEEREAAENDKELLETMDARGELGPRRVDDMTEEQQKKFH